MIRREEIEPPLDREVYVYGPFLHPRATARWVKGGKGYEGWYLVNLNSVMSQKEIKVEYFEDILTKKRRVYIPRKILDDLFDNRDRISPELYERISKELVTS